ncbi:hypothetical protein [Winslowiella iniecta]|uniref:Uncharacterized protein n=1 Tax=Winslowiella iniecta TaxID=1560201 RepID=A0A0L7SX09_9GAMM|nr:hypothetical protein [Winslowiella iniecta]KOC87625.1 hypothetical protein NG42_19580 [Winslowiella iniecta]KOC90765.1 hypothetical protein NG43_16685 [Winslowiella iniecta]
MGKSKSIEQLQKDSERFDKFMQDLSEKSSRIEDKLSEDVSSLVSDYYKKNKWDGKYFFGNKNTDYQLYSEWSLESVNKIINSIAESINTQQFPSPKVPGSEDIPQSTTDEVVQYLSGFQQDYNLTLQRVINIITGFITQFASSTSVTQKTVHQDFNVSGGLHLFIAQSGSVQTEKSFFINSYIGSFQIVFEGHMSVGEAEFTSLNEILKTTQAEIESSDKRIINIDKQMDNSLDDILSTTPVNFELWQTTFDSFNKMKDSVKTQRDKVYDEYKKYKNVIDIVDKHFGKISSGEIDIKKLFTPWQIKLANRYIKEKDVK